MKSMKKILCLFLSVFILAGMITVSAENTSGETLSDSQRQTVMERMETLAALGIVPKYEEINIELDKEVTRADFADAVAKLIRAENYSGSTPYFYDVPSSHWAYQTISSLAERNIINGTAERLFRPDDTIAAVDAVKILLGVMGYGDYAQYQGGYPTGYLATANQIGISKGISMTGTFTNAKMYSLLYQAMTTEMLAGVTYSTSGATTYKVSDDTLLSLYHDMYKVRGVLNGANGVSLLSGKKANADEIQIDDVVYESDVNAFSYLGEKVEAFYRWDGKDDVKTVIWVKPYGTSEILNINVNHDASFDVNSFRLTYAKENRSSGHVDFARSGVLIYNGGQVTDGYGEYFNRGVYRLKMIASNGGGYDVAIMEEYRNMIVGSKDTNNLKVYAKNNSSDVLELDDKQYTFLDIVRDTGSALSFSEIGIGDVLSIFESADKEYLEVRVSSNRINGVVDAIAEQTHEYELMIGEAAYIYPKTTETFTCSAGDSVLLRLDAFGKIADIEVSKSNTVASYLIDAAIKNAALNDGLQFKVLSEADGKIKILDCGEKLTVDGVKYNDMSKVYQKFLNRNGEFQSQLVMITQNAKGEITKIDTAEMGPGEGEGNLQCSVARMKGDWRKSSFSARMAIGANTVVFIIPPEGVAAKDELYAVERQASVPDIVDNTYACSYKTKEKVGCEEYVVLEWARNSIIGWSPILVQSINLVVDDDGEIREKVQGYVGKSEVQYVAADGFSFTDIGVTAGTLIRGYYDKNRKEISSVQKVASLEQAAEKRKGFTALTEFSGIQKGEVIDVVDGVLKMDTRDESADPEGWIGGAADLSMDCRNATVLIYDSSRRKNNIYIGTVSEIIAGDYVAIETNYEKVNTVVVYK